MFRAWDCGIPVLFVNNPLRPSVGLGLDIVQVVQDLQNPRSVHLAFPRIPTGLKMGVVQIANSTSAAWHPRMFTLERAFQARTQFPFDLFYPK